MSNPTPGERTGSSTPQPSLVPGVVLLGLAAVLIVVVVVDPKMAGWLKISITVVAILLVVALLVYAFRVFRVSSGRRK